MQQQQMQMEAQRQREAQRDSMLAQLLTGEARERRLFSISQSLHPFFVFFTHSLVRVQKQFLAWHLSSQKRRVQSAT